MKILVLGGTGTISRYAVNELVKNEYEVTVFNRGNRKEFLNGTARFKKVDVNNYSQLSRALEGEHFDKVVDFTSFTKSQMRIKLSALIEKCDHYIFISTNATYENKGYLTYSEDDNIYNSKWTYGYNKSLCEEVLKEYYAEFSDRYFTILRLCVTWSENFIPFSVFDSYNMPGFIIHSILSGKPLPLLNDGNDKIQVMYAGDFAENLVNLIKENSIKNEILNMTGDEYISSNDILEGLCRYLNKDAYVSYVSFDKVIEDTLNNENIVRGGWHNRFSNEKIKRILKIYKTDVKWADKVSDIVRYYFEHINMVCWSEMDEKFCKKLVKDVTCIKYSDDNLEEFDEYQKNTLAVETILEERKELHKTLKNNGYMSKWLKIKQNGINIFSGLKDLQTRKVVIYGKGILGELAVSELEELKINIEAIIDKAGGKYGQYKIVSNCEDYKDAAIIITVMTAYEDIYNYLIGCGCEKMISLGEIIEKKYLGLNKYPELNKYKYVSENRYDVIALGSGYAYYDFDFKDLSVNAFNFALPQQTFKCDYEILKNYTPLLNKGCKVLIALSICSLLADNVEEIENKNDRYYSILPRETVKDMSHISYDEYIENTVINDDKCIELNTVLTDAGIQEENLYLLGSWIEQLSIISFKSEKMCDIAKRSIEKTSEKLKEMIDYCYEHDFDPIIVVTPINELLAKEIFEEFRESHFYSPLNKVVESKVKVLDFIKSGYFKESRYYGAPVFLTKSAAKEFTKEVLSVI